MPILVNGWVNIAKPSIRIYRHTLTFDKMGVPLYVCSNRAPTGRQITVNTVSMSPRFLGVESRRCTSDGGDRVSPQLGW